MIKKEKYLNYMSCGLVHETVVLLYQLYVLWRKKDHEALPHMVQIIANSAYFVKSTPPRVLGVSF